MFGNPWKDNIGTRNHKKKYLRVEWWEQAKHWFSFQNP
jgi:hypothetical protein